MIDTPTSHIVQLYERDECLIDAVARFTAPAVAAGEPVVIIATERHRQEIEAQLLSQHLPLEQARATGRFVALDAVATLAEIMVDGRPDEARFRAVIGSVLARAADGTARVHVCGEMAALLWAAGDREAAIQLEQFWNHLGERLSLSLLCACPSGASADRRDRAAFRRVCDQHEWVVPSESHRDVGDAEARWRTVADLQQRARAADRLEAERDRVHRSLAERDALLGAVVTASPVALVVIDIDTTVVRLWNPAAERLFGWPADEVIGRPIPIVPAEKHDECACVRRAMAVGEYVPARIPTYRSRRDGSLVPVAISGAALGGEVAPARVLLVFEDLSEQQPAEEARARLAAIVESSGDAIVGKTLQGIVTSWNAGAERIFGYRADEMIGQSIRRLIPPDRSDDETRILAAIARGERVEPFESTRLRKDGGRIDVSITVSPIRDSAGRIIGASKIARDVSDRQRAERERQRNLRELETLYAVGQTVAAQLDRERVLQMITDAATNVSGATFGSFLSRTVTVGGGRSVLCTLSGAAHDACEGFGASRDLLVFGPTFAGAGVIRVADMRTDPRYAHSGLHFGGPTAPVPVASYLAVPVASRTGEVWGGLFLGHPEAGVFGEEAERVVVALAAQAAIALDNAKLYEAEQIARAAAEEASRAKDHFLAMLGHELRNPLSSVRNAVTTAALDPARARRALEIARHGADQLTRLVDDLLDVTRIARQQITLRRERVGLRDVVQRALDAVQPLFEERAVAVGVSLPTRECELDGDAARLEQVVDNLLVNAAKYTEPGGRAVVSLHHVGGEAVLRVRDTGIGIRADLLPRVFDLFVQAHQALDRTRGGLGIGLTLVKQIVEMHGGRVEARSEGVGRGAEFIVRLPARLRVEPATPVPVKAPRAPDACVLIVEDNVEAAESLMMLLEALGLRVGVAGDGATALAAARITRPDVMLIDIGLPGMNGYELARSIRGEAGLSGITLVALTGYGQEEDRQRALAAGFDHHLVKPIEVDAVRRLIRGAAPPSLAD